MTIAERQTAPIVILSSELDLYDAPRVRDALDALQGPGVVDMSAVRRVGSSVLNELARVAKRAGRHRVELIVTSPHVRKVLDIVQFGRLFDIVGDANTESAG